MKLNSYRTGNFKSFGPVPQEIQLKPITLVFGPNSAGKSSIIHSLLWLNHMLGNRRSRRGATARWRRSG